MSHRIVSHLVAGILVFAIGLGSAASAGASSDAAHACQHGGYLNWTRADGTPFKNTGACVSYVAQGGTLYPVVPRTGTLLLYSIELNADTPEGWCALETQSTGFPPGTYVLIWYDMVLEEELNFLEYNVVIDESGTLPGGNTVSDFEGPFIAQTRLYYGGVEVARSPVVTCVPMYPES